MSKIFATLTIQVVLESDLITSDEIINDLDIEIVGNECEVYNVSVETLKINDSK